MIQLQEILSGDFLKRGWFREQRKLILLLFALIFLYIYSGYSAQREQRQLNEIQKQLQDARYEDLTLSAELMQSTRSSAVADELAKRGSKVKESSTPVIHIQ